MKATELRIGNTAREITHSRNEIVQVSVRHFEDIELGEIDLFPIPLTEELLLSMGFEWYNDEEMCLDHNYFLTPTNKKETEWYCNDLGVDLKYVHQLQNLYFAIKGEELTLKELA